MNHKILLAAALCAALAACGKKEEPAPASAPAPEAPAAAAPAASVAEGGKVELPAVNAAAEAASGSADAGTLPKACEDYIARASACFAKAAPDAVAMLKQSNDTMIAEWKKVEDKALLAETCKNINDQFADTAKSMNCE